MSFHLQYPTRTLIKEIFYRKNKFSYFVYRLKWNVFPKINYVSSYPLHVDVEITNKCNLRCIMCIQQSKEGRKNQGEIDFDMACKVLEAIGGKVYSVKFNWRGETLLYKKLPELIAKAKDSGIQEVQINSNGLLLTKKLSRDLIYAGLDRIIFSVDGYSSETYEKIRLGGSYSVLLNNIHVFLDEKKRQKTNHPFVRVQMCVGEENRHEVYNFSEYWRYNGVQVALIERQDREARLRNITYKTGLVSLVRCKQPWQRLTISWEGRVFPCCADWFESTPLLWKISKEDTVEQIREGLQNSWKKGQVISCVRKALWKGRGLNSLCGRCPFVIENGKDK